MSNEFIGSGITFGFNSAGSPSTYTTLAGIASLEPPASIADDLDASALDSTAKEFVTGLADPGECTMVVNLRKATTGSAPWVASQTAFEAYANDGVLHGFKITFPGSTTVVYSFSGFVKQFKISRLDPNAVATADVVIKVSGAITKA